MKLKTVNEYLLDRKSFGVYFLWCGRWSSSHGPHFAMHRLFLIKPKGGWVWTPIVRITLRYPT